MLTSGVMSPDPSCLAQYVSWYAECAVRGIKWGRENWAWKFFV
jgi:hypothetical protein